MNVNLFSLDVESRYIILSRVNYAHVHLSVSVPVPVSVCMRVCARTGKFRFHTTLQTAIGRAMTNEKGIKRVVLNTCNPFHRDFFTYAFIRSITSSRLPDRRRLH